MTVNYDQSAKVLDAIQPGWRVIGSNVAEKHRTEHTAYVESCVRCQLEVIVSRLRKDHPRTKMWKLWNRAVIELGERLGS